MAKSMRCAVLLALCAISASAQELVTATNYKTDDGQQRIEATDGQGNVRGEYSYVDPNGKTIKVRYTAGKDGFKVEGDHLPVSPNAGPSAPKAAAPAQDSDVLWNVKPEERSWYQPAQQQWNQQPQQQQQWAPPAPQQAQPQPQWNHQPQQHHAAPAAAPQTTDVLWNVKPEEKQWYQPAQQQWNQQPQQQKWAAPAPQQAQPQQWNQPQQQWNQQPQQQQWAPQAQQHSAVQQLQNFPSLPQPHSNSIHQQHAQPQPQWNHQPQQHHAAPASHAQASDVLWNVKPEERSWYKQ